MKLITLHDCLTISEAAKRYNVKPGKIQYRITTLKKTKPELLEQLMSDGFIKFTGNTFLVTTALMDIWFVKKEKPVIIPRDAKEYIANLSSIEEVVALKKLIVRQELFLKSANDFASRVALKFDIPHHVASGFLQLAKAIDVSVEDFRIRNWKNKRVYYKDPRRSKSAHQDGYFYYCLKDNCFVNPYLENEGLFGLKVVLGGDVHENDL